MTDPSTPEWRNVRALRAELDSTSPLVDYHGGEILNWLDEAPQQLPDGSVVEAEGRAPDVRRRDLDTPHPTIPKMSVPNPNAALNVVAEAVADLFGWLPLSVRYAAAEAAMAEAYRYIHDRESDVAASS